MANNVTPALRCSFIFKGFLLNHLCVALIGYTPPYNAPRRNLRRANALQTHVDVW